MKAFTAFGWQGVDKVYTLPWLRNTVEITSEPDRIAQYARTAFTRSRTLMALLTAFHLSRGSILVSSDAHAAHLRGKLIKRFPALPAYPAIARDLVERLLHPAQQVSGASLTIRSGDAVREMYLTLLQSMLGVRILPPLQGFIDAADFSPGWRPLRMEAFLYSLNLHLPIFAPVRWAMDIGLFHQARRMRRVARSLETLVCSASVPLAGSWLEALIDERIAGRMTRAQFRGEITAILVSSFSLASTLTFMLQCLAAVPHYRAKIQADPDFARHFLAEVLRLYPPFHQFGYQPIIEAGARPGSATTDLLISALFLHRNPAIWDLPNHFRPERFEEQTASNRFHYLPFGMGPRLCPGRSYALRLLTEVLKFLCSDACPVVLQPVAAMPLARAGRIISYPVDDRITVTAAPI